MSNRLTVFCFWITLLILTGLSVSQKVLNLNLFVLFVYVLFYSFINYKNIHKTNIFHISWISLALSFALFTNNVSAQIASVAIVPLSLVIESIKSRQMKTFVTIQLLSIALFTIAIILNYIGDPSTATLLILISLLIRQVQFPFHIWIKDVRKNQCLYPSFLFFILVQSGFILYAQKYVQYHHESYLLISLVPGITILTGLLTAISALREKNSLNRHLLIIISQSCLPLASYHSFSTTSATGGILFSLLLSISGCMFASIAYQVFIQKGVLILNKKYSLYRTNKNYGLIYLISGLSIVGLPFTMGFFAEDILLHGLIQSSPFYAVIYIFITAINAFTVFMTFNTIFFGHTQNKWSPIYLTSSNRLFITITFVLITFSGFFVGPISTSIEKRLLKNNKKIAISLTRTIYE